MSHNSINWFMRRPDCGLEQLPCLWVAQPVRALPGYVAVTTGEVGWGVYLHHSLQNRRRKSEPRLKGWHPSSEVIS